MTPEKYKDHIRAGIRQAFRQAIRCRRVRAFLASDMSAWVNGAPSILMAVRLPLRYRTPSNNWTGAPVVTGDGFGYSE